MQLVSDRSPTNVQLFRICCLFLALYCGVTRFRGSESVLFYRVAQIPNTRASTAAFDVSVYP